MKLIKIKFAAFSAGLLLVGASVPPLGYALAAQSPSAISTAVTQTMETQTIVLKHVIPADILKPLHWDQPPNLPAGVTKVEADPAHNALIVTATPAGFAKVQESVKLLDFMPREIKIDAAFALASTAEVQASGIQSSLAPVDRHELNESSNPNCLRYTTGEPAAKFLQVLTNRNELVEKPTITTTDKATAAIMVSLPPMSAQNTIFEVQKFAVTPQINSDNSITMGLDATFYEGSSKLIMYVTHTVPSGQTLVLVFSSPFPHSRGKNILLFVTPTIK